MSRILVVEDEPGVQQLLCEALRDESGAPLLAGTCADARKWLGCTPDLDVVLLDKHLPDGSGFELLPSIRVEHPEAEVILITAYASLDSAIQALTASMFDYLTKPFADINDVVVRVRNARQKARLSRERQKLLQQLSESEERYRQLFESSSDAIVVWEADSGRIVDANTTAVRLYGYSKSELLHLRAEQLRGTQSAGTPFALRQDVRKDGATIPVEITTGSFSASGRRMVVEVARDVSERLRADQTRRELEEQLRQAQKMEALGRLAGGVAHDFNNVLAIVMCYSQFVAEALQKHPEMADTLEDCQQVLAAGETAVSLTRQLLAFSRKQVVTAESLDLNKLVTELRQLFRRTLGEHIQIETELDSNLPHVRLERAQAAQMLTNLAVNARDAMPGGGVLRIVTQAQGEAAVIQVSDTGRGIPADALPSIFDPFFSPFPSNDETGKGLGLATVYGIVTHAGGSIDVASSEAGSTFTIKLPTAAGLDGSAAQRSRVNGSLHAQGETILVVEDEPSVLALVRRMLERAEYRVVEARSGLEALDKARGQKLDMLLTDVVMPGMAGTELARRLKSDLPGPRVIYMSGYATEPIIQQGVVSAGLAFLPKPFSEEQLLTLVRSVLDVPMDAPSAEPGK